MLDPLLYFQHKIADLIMWKNPYKTFMMGVVLSISIIYTKTFILLGGLLLYFGRGYIFKRLFRLQSFKDRHRRLIVPQENMFFLQENMENYIKCY